MSTRRSASPLPSPRRSMSLRTPVEVSACTTAIMLGDGCAASRRSGSIGSPQSASTRDNVGAMTRRHFAHPLAEHAVDADDDRVARPDEVDEGGLHAGRAGPAHRQRQCVGGGEDLTQPVVRLVEEGQELRIEVAEHGAGQRHRDFRVRVGRPRAHEEAVGYPHRRIVTGPCSPAPTRRAARRASDRLPAWIGCSSPLGRCRPSLPTSPRIPDCTRPGHGIARSGG